MTGEASPTGELTTAEMASLLAEVGATRSVAAFERLFRHFGPRVKSYLVALTKDAAAAEELMQETMITVWNKAALFDPARGSVTTWVFTIARNLRIDALRKARRPSFDPEDPAFVPEDEPPAEDTLIKAQKARALGQAMQTLPEEQAELLRLSFFEEASHSTIAERTGLPIGTVKSRIRLAFGRLRAQLGDRA